MFEELVDDLPDDARVVVRVPHICGDRRTTAEQQPVVGGQPEVGIDELRIPALHLLARGEQRPKLPVGQRFGNAQECLGVKNFVRVGADRFFQLVHGDDDLVGRDAAGVRVHGMVLEPFHFRALEDLHAMFDEQVLESLQAGEWIDAVGSAVANAGAVPFRAEDAFQLPLVVGFLIRETDFLPAMQLRIHCLFSAFAEAQKQRVLLQQSALDVVFLDGGDQALDAPQRRLPDLARGLDAVAAHQLVQLELAVGCEKARTASRGAAADDVLVEQHDLVAAL